MASSSTKQVRCSFCGEPADYLCDFVHGFSGTFIETEKGGRLLTNEVEPVMETCDAPICESCRSQQGMRFFCGTDGGVETIDLCPIHISANSPGVNPITKGEAQKYRLKDWMLICL